ncbi:MAG: peptidyl-prolyl cis-trans isomerase [Deltaproteobacteria bacterium]|nr:peptidyl-prolyl cis-trans isomerase [Deltaproteobacteria bacterium]
MKKTFFLIGLLLFAFSHFVWADPPETQVKLETSFGDIIVELDRIAAPKTVENFLRYVTGGAYDGTIFHRVIDGFMIQGGGFTPDMRKKPTYPPIRNEASNGLSNSRGTVAMARTNDPHTATNQFFINTEDNRSLDHRYLSRQGKSGYCVFGKVVSGMDVVNRITKVETGRKSGRADVPIAPVLIKRALVVTPEKTDLDS